MERMKNSNQTKASHRPIRPVVHPVYPVHLVVGLPCLGPKVAVDPGGLEPEGIDAHVEPETAFAAAAGVEAHVVGDQPHVAEVLRDAVGLLVEAAPARITQLARDTASLKKG